MSTVSQSNGFSLPSIDFSKLGNNKDVSETKSGEIGGHKVEQEQPSKPSKHARTISTIFKERGNITARGEGSETSRTGNMTARSFEGGYIPQSSGKAASAFSKQINKSLAKEAHPLKEAKGAEIKELSSQLHTLKAKLENLENKLDDRKTELSQTKRDLQEQLKVIDEKNFKQELQTFVDRQDHSVAEKLGVILSDPAQFEILHQEAKKEFSTENLIFYKDLETLANSKNPEQVNKLANKLLSQVKGQQPDINLDDKANEKANTLFQKLSDPSKSFKEFPQEDRDSLTEVLQGAITNMTDTYPRAQESIKKLINEGDTDTVSKDLSLSAKNRVLEEHDPVIKDLQSQIETLKTEIDTTDKEIKSQEIQINNAQISNMQKASLQSSLLKM